LCSFFCFPSFVFFCFLLFSVFSFVFFFLLLICLSKKLVYGLNFNPISLLVKLFHPKMLFESELMTMQNIKDFLVPSLVPNETKIRSVKPTTGSQSLKTMRNALGL